MADVPDDDATRHRRKKHKGKHTDKHEHKRHRRRRDHDSDDEEQPPPAQHLQVEPWHSMQFQLVDGIGGYRGAAPVVWTS